MVSDLFGQLFDFSFDFTGVFAALHFETEIYGRCSVTRRFIKCKGAVHQMGF